MSERTKTSKHHVLRIGEVPPYSGGEIPAYVSRSLRQYHGRDWLLRHGEHDPESFTACYSQLAERLDLAETEESLEQVVALGEAALPFLLSELAENGKDPAWRLQAAAAIGMTVEGSETDDARAFFTECEQHVEPMLMWGLEKGYITTDLLHHSDYAAVIPS